MITFRTQKVPLCKKTPGSPDHNAPFAFPFQHGRREQAGQHYLVLARTCAGISVGYQLMPTGRGSFPHFTRLRFCGLAAPNGIAFDNLGDLSAASSAAPFGIADFAKSQLLPSTAASPAPSTFLVGTNFTLNAHAGITFGPIVH
jgi:hypothetical protein